MNIEKIEIEFDEWRDLKIMQGHNLIRVSYPYTEFVNKLIKECKKEYSDDFEFYPGEESIKRIKELKEILREILNALELNHNQMSGEENEKILDKATKLYLRG